MPTRWHYPSSLTPLPVTAVPQGCAKRPSLNSLITLLKRSNICLSSCEMSKQRRLENGQVEEHFVPAPPLDMAPVSRIARRAMLYANLCIREADPTMSVETDLKISTNLKPRVMGETDPNTAVVSFGLKHLAKMAPCQGISTMGHERGHVMEIFKNLTN